MSDGWWIPALAATGIFLVFALLIVGRAHAIANILALLVVGSVIVLGVLQLHDDPDSESCRSPLSRAEQEGPARRAALVALRDAQETLRSVRAEALADPSPARTRAVRDAERRLRAKQDKWRLWRPAVVTVSETENTSFKLGHDVNGGTRSIAFGADHRIPGPTAIDVHVNSFASEGAGRELGDTVVTAWAELQPGRENGTIFFCIPPDVRKAVPSGQFVGEFVLQTGRVQRTAVPVTLSIPDANLTTVLLAALATLAAASWYVYYLRREHLSDQILYGGPLSTDPAVAADQKDASSRVLRWSFGFWHGYWRWLCSTAGAITIVAGTATATAAFSTTYLSSDTWSGSLRDWFALLGAVATAFVAGGTAGKLAQLTPDTTGTTPTTTKTPPPPPPPNAGAV